MPGAGTLPAGSAPAGLETFTPSVPAAGVLVESPFLDPSTGDYATDNPPYTSTTSGVVIELDAVDSEMATITAIERGSLPCFPELGNTFRARLRATTRPEQRPAAVNAAANESYAAPIQRGDVTLLEVTVDVLALGAITVLYQNNRVPNSNPRVARPQ